MSVKAYYSVVQFIPDPDRDERLNLAVILQSPEYGYAGVEIRRYIDRAIGCIFPACDGQMIHYAIHGIAHNFAAYASEPESKLLDFGSISPEHPTHPDYLQRFNSPFGQIFIREPKPIFIRENQGFQHKLDQLYKSLIDSEKPERTKTHLTKHDVKVRVEGELARRHVSLIKSPPKFPGKRWPNSFDALKEKRNRRWLQYMSFDQYELPVDQAKSFLASVDDMRASGRYPDDEYACVIQSPQGELRDRHRDTFSSAIVAMRQDEISVFLNDDEGIARLAYALENNNGLRSMTA